MLGGAAAPWQLRRVVLVATTTAWMPADPHSHGSSFVPSTPLSGGLLHRVVSASTRPRPAASIRLLTSPRGYVGDTDR
jgi:hypothetical protein